MTNIVSRGTVGRIYEGRLQILLNIIIETVSLIKLLLFQL